jgi:hypothetical protein
MEIEMKNEIEELRKTLSYHETRISKLEDITSGRSVKTRKLPQGQKQLSIKEFLRLKSPKSKVHKTLAIGYYLERFDDMSSFNVDDIRISFKAAKEPAPSNIQAFINQNISNGHMMDFKEKKNKKKAYVLTNSGEEYVEKGFKKPE